MDINKIELIDTLKGLRELWNNNLIKEEDIGEFLERRGTNLYEVLNLAIKGILLEEVL